jgi:hypothetical protein
LYFKKYPYNETIDMNDQQRLVFYCDKHNLKSEIIDGLHIV